MSLETFAPTPRNITVAERDLAILPLKMRELPAFATAIRDVAGHLLAGDLTSAMTADAGGIAEAVTVAARVDRDWIDGLWPDQFAELAGVVFEVNADFFARRVLPATRAAAQSLTAAIQASLGDTSSPGSASADIASPTASG